MHTKAWKSARTWARLVTMATHLYKVNERRVHAASFVLLSSLTLNLTTMAFSNSLLDRGHRSILKTPFERPSHSRVFYPTLHIDEHLVRKYGRKTRFSTSPQQRSTHGYPSSHIYKEDFQVEEDLENVEESDEILSGTESIGVRVRLADKIYFFNFGIIRHNFVDF